MTVTYSTLQTRVLRRVIDAPAAVQAEVGSLINDAIRSLQRERHFKVMEATTGLLTTTVGARTLSTAAVPSNFKEYRGKPYYQSYLGQTYDMVVVQQRQAAHDLFGIDVDRDIGYPILLLDAEPSTVAGARNWEVFPYPDGNSDWSDGEYRVVVPYWKWLPVLSAGGDSNWFTDNADDFIIYKATSAAFALDWDEARSSYWEGEANKLKGEIIKRDKLLRLSSFDTLAVHMNVNDPALSR